MKAIILLAILAVMASAMFTEDLVQKYSIEVIEAGTEGTAPQKGDSVEMHYKG